MDIKHICEEYYQTVFGYLISLTCGDYDLAQELTQETFYRAIKKAGTFQGKRKMSTWLCQIAKFTFYQHLDRKRRRREVSIDETVALAAEQGLEQEFLENEGKLEIFRRIQKLQSPMKDVMLLRLTGELSFQEIGDILGKSENWARVTFYRGKQVIGRGLKENG